MVAENFPEQKAHQIYTISNTSSFQIKHPNFQPKKQNSGNTNSNFSSKINKLKKKKKSHINNNHKIVSFRFVFPVFGSIFFPAKPKAKRKWKGIRRERERTLVESTREANASGILGFGFLERGVVEASFAGFSGESCGAPIRVWNWLFTLILILIFFVFHFFSPGFFAYKMIFFVLKRECCVVPTRETWFRFALLSFPVPLAPLNK